MEVICEDHKIQMRDNFTVNPMLKHVTDSIIQMPLTCMGHQPRLLFHCPKLSVHVLYINVIHVMNNSS